MDRGPDGAGSHTPGVRGSRRLLAAGLAAVVVLLVVIAVLATRLADTPPVANAKAAAPSPTPTAAKNLTVPAIYQRVAPSVVIVRAGHDLGTGVIVADDGTILTANHVITSGGVISVTFADGTTADATVAAADPKLDIATLTRRSCPRSSCPPRSAEVPMWERPSSPSAIRSA